MIIAVLALLIFLHYLRVLAPIENVIVTVISPILHQAQTWGTSLTRDYKDQSSREELLTENERLSEQLNNLIVENAQLRLLEEENKILRENLRFFAENEQSYVMSHVIARSESIDITERSNSIIIDKGQRDGVKNGLAVINGQGIIIGKVVETKDRTAKIYLTNNPECKLAATILNNDRTQGITEGELGLTTRMKFIPQNQELRVGEVVVTSGLEEAIPRGLIIGKVMSIQQESNELWQSALIEPLIDMDELLIVSVLIP